MSRRSPCCSGPVPLSRRLSLNVCSRRGPPHTCLTRSLPDALRKQLHPLHVRNPTDTLQAIRQRFPRSGLARAAFLSTQQGCGILRSYTWSRIPSNERAALNDPSFIISNFVTFLGCLRKEACSPPFTPCIVQGYACRRPKALHCGLGAQRGGRAYLPLSSVLFVLQMVQNGRLQQAGHTLLVLPDLRSGIRLRDSQSLCCSSNFFLTHY